MKTTILSAMLLCFSSLAFAQTAPSLVGHWELTKRSCSSGAQPWDNFVPGRDSYKIEILKDSFYTRAWVGRCQILTEGDYKQDTKILQMTVTRAWNNCGNPNDLLGRFTYMYEKTTDKSFTIYVGPVRGGVCPAGDLLKNEYTLLE